jgi:hypothetical protein
VPATTSSKAANGSYSASVVVAMDGSLPLW